MRFRILGVDATTGEPVRPLYLEALDTEAAIAEALRAGLRITAIDAAAAPDPLMSPESRQARRDARAAIDILNPWSRNTRRIGNCLKIAIFACVLTCLLAFANLNHEDFPSVILFVIVPCFALACILAAAWWGLHMLADIALMLRDLGSRLPPSDEN